jgi:hypothetical protein
MRPSLLSRPPSEAASSLEESSYDLVSDPDLSESGILSDDDARTESLASFDGNTPDDMSVINGAEDSEEEDALNTPLDSIMLGGMHTQNYTARSDEPVVDVIPTIGESGYTSRTVRPESSVGYLDFYVNESEPSGPNDINLVHTVQSVDDANCKPELSVYETKYVGVEMHVAVSKASPKPRDSFRVLIMSYFTHHNGDVAEHIKGALQTAFQGEITDEQPSLVMHHCAGGGYGFDGREIILALDRPGPSAVHVRGGKIWLGKDLYPLWDLAIFLHTSLAEIPPYEIPRLEYNFDKARLAMRSCKIPIMDLSMHHPLYRAVPHLYTCDRKSLRLCVTTKKSKDADEIPCEMLPIDLDKFFAIDPRTLGRHIACITERDPASDRASQKRKRSIVLDRAYDSYIATKKFIRPVMVRTREHIRSFHDLEWTSIVLGVFLALATIVFCIQIPGYLSSTQANLATRIPPAATPAPLHQADKWADLIGQKFSALSEKPSANAAPSISSKSVVQPDESMAKKTQDTPATNVRSSKSKSVLKQEDETKKEQEMVAHAYTEYTLDLVGGHTLVLTPPARLIKRVKASMDVCVLRNGRKLDTILKPMANGVSVAIDVREDQAHGEATVLVYGHYQLPYLGKVPFTYEFPVDFGNRNTKTPFEAMREMVAQEFVLVQNNAMELSTRMSTGLQQYMDELQQRTLALQKHAMQRVDKTRKALLNLSPHDISTAEYKPKTQQLKQLKNTKKALEKHRKDISAQFEATVRAVQDMAIQQYYDAAEAIRAIPAWQQETAWPVRAVDWKPTTAVKRGWGNAQGLLRKLRGGPKLIGATARDERPDCRGWVHRRRGSSRRGRH